MKESMSSENTVIIPRAFLVVFEDGDSFSTMVTYDHESMTEVVQVEENQGRKVILIHEMDPHDKTLSFFTRHLLTLILEGVEFEARKEVWG